MPTIHDPGNWTGHCVALKGSVTQSVKVNAVIVMECDHTDMMSNHQQSLNTSHFQDILAGLHNGRGRDSEGLNDLLRFAGPGDAGHRQLLDDGVPDRGEAGQDGVPQSSLRIVILHRHHSTSTGRTVVLHGGPVQRFDGERIHHTDGDSLSRLR